MTVRWRDLLDHIGIQWSDSSRYAGHGFIGIKCPWCGDDPGFHLGINEEHGYYNCLRSNQHRGRSPYWLLKALGVQSYDMDDLLTAFGGVPGQQPSVTKASSLPSASSPADRWRKFKPAVGDGDALEYLQRRGFTEPKRTADDFDLKTGSNRYARRVWFKLTDIDSRITGFTGRAIDDWRSPRYYTEADEVGLYTPRQPAGRHRLALLVEGPMDALRIADATRRRANLFVAALCGLSITSNKRRQLLAIARTMPNFLVALDGAVWANDAQRLIAELRAIPSLGNIRRLPMPAGVSDPGEMTNSGVERWLSTI